MPIQMPKQNKGGIGKLMAIGQTVAGVMSGNPGLIANGVSGMAGDTPMGRAAGMYGVGKDMMGGAAPQGGSGAAPAGARPSLGVNTDLGYGGDAMKRMYQRFGMTR